MVLPVMFAFAYCAYILNSETSTLIHSFNNGQRRKDCQPDCFFTFVFLINNLLPFGFSRKNIFSYSTVNVRSIEKSISYAFD